MAATRLQQLRSLDESLARLSPFELPSPPRGQSASLAHKYTGNNAVWHSLAP